MLITIVDTDAFVHVALYGILGALGLVIAFSLALVGVDRAEEGEGRRWLALTVLGGAACVALLAVGVWAMTQK